jgi:hypothetical protein
VVTKVVDSKGRLALGSRFVGRTVIVDDSDPNKIVITPAVVIPESEAWLYQNTKALASVRAGLDQASQRQFASDIPDLDGDSGLAAKMKD